MFYVANTCDTHQDKEELFTLPEMKEIQRVKWVDGEDAWFADFCIRNLAALTPLTAPWWLYKMDQYMAYQKYTIAKKVGAFL
jgi:hypothetical protein